MIGYYLRTCVVLVLAADYAAAQIRPTYPLPAPQVPNYGAVPQKTCQTYVVTTTVATPQYYTDTKYLTQYQTQYQTKHHTQYQTQYKTQYVTKKQPVSIYITKVVSSYVTHTQQVAQYVTQTVPTYVTTTVKVPQTVTQSCLPAGAGGYGGNTGGSANVGYGNNGGFPDIDVRQRTGVSTRTDTDSKEWVWE